MRNFLKYTRRIKTMCNLFNSTAYNGSRCCYNGGLWNTTQRVCRDCCGNIHVCNCCNCSCGCGGSNNSGNTQAGGNGNGGYGCVTVCGALTSGATTATQTPRTSCGDAYYARQYGWCGCNRSSFCSGLYNSVYTND